LREKAYVLSLEFPANRFQVQLQFSLSSFLGLSKSAEIEIRSSNILSSNLHQHVKFGLKSGLSIFCSALSLSGTEARPVFPKMGKIAKNRGMEQGLGRMTS